MNLLDLSQLAEQSGLPLSQARYFRDRFILFVPSVRIGRKVLHPVEAVDVVRLIGERAAAGAGAAEIEAVLEQAFPVTVITSQEVGTQEAAEADRAAKKTLADEIGERVDGIRSEIAALQDALERTATSEQLDTVARQTQMLTGTRAESTGLELRQVRAAVEELQARLGQVASRDHLEAIRGAVSTLGEKLTGVVTAEQLRSALEESRLVTEAESRSTGQELRQVRAELEELQARLGVVASRDQLEWIGDVVSAAILRPADSGLDLMERKLSEIQEEMRRPRPTDDAAELRIAVEHLTEHVRRRDAEYQNALEALVGALRGEIGELHHAVGELKQEIRASAPPSLLTDRLAAARSEMNHRVAHLPHSTDDSVRIRSPRRLGQSNRQVEHASHDLEAAHGAD